MSGGVYEAGYDMVVCSVWRITRRVIGGASGTLSQDPACSTPKREVRFAKEMSKGNSSVRSEK